MRLFAVILLAFLAQQAQGAKILATLAFPGRSQYIFVENYLKALAARGHEVTVINTLDNKPTPNMRFIKAPEIHKYFNAMMMNMFGDNLWQQLNHFDEAFIKATECLLDDPGVQRLMQSGEKFDLVLTEVLQTEVLFGLAQHFNATLIGFSSYGTDWHIDEAMGNTSPVAYSPLIASPRIDRMTYYERLQNMFELMVEMVHFRFLHLPRMEKLYAKYMPQAQQTLTQVRDSFSLMLLGQHFSMSHPRPYLPNMIEMGGSHIAHKPAPLPADIEDFIQGAGSAGVIYFSLGSNVKSKDLPLQTRELLLKVFASLPQRVLWKFEEDQLEGKPANVYINKWFPQSDILAHPNVKLFITHGGLLSTMESIYHGMPVLGLPVFYDQFMNVERARRLGFGIGLDLQNLQESQLKETINILLTTPSYAQVSAQLSARYRDQPEPALDRAVWWTEYVLRHKGAPHMRVAARDLNFFQQHSLDTLAVLIGGPILLLVLLIHLSCKLLRRSLGGKKKRVVKQKRH